MLKRRDAPPADHSPATQDRILLVEGVEDARFYECILTHCQVSNDVEIRFTQGRTNLAIASSAILAVSPRVRVLATIQDARDSAAGTLATIQNALGTAGLPVPVRSGAISPATGSVTTAALVVPEDEPGGLESVCWTSIQDQLVPALVQRFLTDLLDHDPAQASVTVEAQAKHLIGTVLAAGVRGGPFPVKPGLRLGEAAEAHFWNFEHPAFSFLLQFVRAVAAL